MRYEGIVYRPPSEAYSYILQATIGCSQNHCTFCNMYKGKRFKIRKIEDVLEDLKMARKSYSKISRIFIADGDALICKTDYLKSILTYIRENIPECSRVTCYGSPKSILLKSPSDLKELYDMGLVMIYLGLESGSDKILELVKKGVTSAQMIEAASKLKEAGMQLSVTAISGLGGKARWKEHAIDTARVLSQMNPEYIGLLTLMVEDDTELAEEVRAGNFESLSSFEVMEETLLMLQEINCDHSIFRSNHASNYLNLKGILNQDKEMLLNQLQLALDHKIRLKDDSMRVL